MDQIAINASIEPILSNPGIGHIILPEMAVQKTVLLHSTVLVKDICNVVMHKVGLHDLANRSSVYIQSPKPMYYIYSAFLHNSSVNIGDIKNLIGPPINIKILVHRKIEDFIVFDQETGSFTNSNKPLFNEDHTTQDSSSYIAVKIIESIREVSIEGISNENLYEIDERIKRELHLMSKKGHSTLSSLMSITGIQVHKRNGSSGITNYSDKESFLNNNTLPEQTLQKFLPNNWIENYNIIPDIRSKFDELKEEPILEVWYQQNKIPKYHQLVQYSNYLNIYSSRLSYNRITSNDIKSWFIDRITQEMEEK